jgi:hypothetical protein
VRGTAAGRRALLGAGEQRERGTRGEAGADGSERGSLGGWGQLGVGSSSVRCCSAAVVLRRCEGGQGWAAVHGGAAVVGVEGRGCRVGVSGRGCQVEGVRRRVVVNKQRPSVVAVRESTRGAQGWHRNEMDKETWLCLSDRPRFCCPARRDRMRAKLKVVLAHPSNCRVRLNTPVPRPISAVWPSPRLSRQPSTALDRQQQRG